MVFPKARLVVSACLFLAWIGFLAYLVARTRDREAARDLLQDVLIAVLRSVRDGALRDSERLVPFVHGTARNLVNNYFRDKVREPKTEELSDVHAQMADQDALELGERERLVGCGLGFFAKVRAVAVAIKDMAEAARADSQLEFTRRMSAAKQQRRLHVCLLKNAIGQPANLQPLKIPHEAAAQIHELV